MTMSLQGNRLEHRYIERDDHLKTQKTAIYLQAKERGLQEKPPSQNLDVELSDLRIVRK